MSQEYFTNRQHPTRRSSKLASFAGLLVSSALIEYASGCMQIELQKIDNVNGVITDYETPQDELEVWLGLWDGSVIYKTQLDIRPWGSRSYPYGFLTIPCFDQETFYIQLIEKDTAVDESK